MNIYEQKLLWKRFLVIAGLVIVLSSLWYSSLLVDKIAKDERKKVELWAEAIKKKALLVNYTDKLFDKLRNEERKKVELYVEAIKRLTNPNPNINPDYTFLSKVVTNNTTVPVVLTDDQNKVKTYRNIDSVYIKNPDSMVNLIETMKQLYEPILISYLGNKKDYVYYKDSQVFTELQSIFDDLQSSFISEVVSNAVSVPVIFTDSTKTQVIAYGNIDSVQINNKTLLTKLIENMSNENKPIEIELQEGQFNYIFYRDSWILTQLKYYPFIQFGVMGIFILIAYFLFSSARKAEQNQVWVGMSKETAHQLGTPLSSLMAWVELMKTKNVDNEITIELDKDVQRLNTITERFSKIGSAPVLETENMVDVVSKSLEYLKSRSSKKIKYSLKHVESQYQAKVNIPLFDWVIENLTKNAIDAMNGEGNIIFSFEQNSNQVIIDVTDTGKGIPTSKRKTVFEPGYTTKKRGWGLGLSLSKRIVEDYHKGKIFVKQTKPGIGTTFRILLNK